MSVEENKAIVRRYIEETLANLDVLDEIFAKEITVYDGTQSRDDFRASQSRILASFPDAQTTIEWMVGEGDQVAVGWMVKATHTGEWLDIPPTNKEVEWFNTTCFQIADGKIVAMRNSWSVHWFFNQIGLSPSFKEIIEQAGGKVPD